MYELLRFFDVPKSSYLSWLSNNGDKYIEEKKLIADIFNGNKGRYGYRRITASLRSRGVIINHKTALKLMKELAASQGQESCKVQILQRHCRKGGVKQA